jgi:hypothetical protein
VQDLREASTARVTECVALALVIGFFLWEFVTLPIAVHKGLAVSLVGGLVAVIFLRAAVLLRRASAGPFRSSSTADPLELAQRRKRLDPQRLPVGGLLAAATVLFAIPLTVLFWILAYVKGLGSGVGLRWFFLIVPVMVALGALLWLVGSGFLADVVGQRQRSPSSLWRRRRTELRTPGGRSGAERSPAAEPGDAFASVDCAALARVLAARLSDALGADFVVSASVDNSILVKHSEREQLITPRLGRFRLEPPATAVALTSQQVLSEIQRFATETLNRPWPARPQREDPGLLQHSPARSRAAESDGLVYLSWQDGEGTVRALETFPLQDVLVVNPND